MNVILLGLALAAAPEAAVTVTETATEFLVATADFSATIQRSRGVLTRLALADRVFTNTAFALGLTDFERAGPDIYHFAEALAQTDRDAAVTTELLERGPARVRLRVTWKSSRALATEIIEIAAGSPWVRQEYELRPTRPLAEARIGLAATVGGFNASRGLFFPDRQRVGAVPWANPWYESGRFRPAPGWVMAFDPDTQAGLCMGVPPGTDLDRYDYGCLGSPEFEGFDRKDPPNVLKLMARSRRLDLSPQDLYRFEVLVYVARSPHEAEALFRRACASRLPPAPPVSIFRLWPEKLVFDNRSPAQITVTLDNHTDTAQTVHLETVLESGLDRRRPLATRDLTLPPRARLDVPFTWTTDDEEWGFEALATLRQDGRLLHETSETFAVTTDWPKVFHIFAGGGVEPVGGEIRAEKMFIPLMRENYLCAVQSFNWCPADGRLVPSSQPYLCADLKKRRWQGTAWQIEALHRQGLRMQFYWWIGSLPPGRLDFAEDPTLCLFHPDGQLAVINGPLPHLFLPRFRRFVAEQFCQAIAACGWDSVMFDEVGTLAQFASLCDWQGRPAGRLMGTDPDQIAGLWFQEIKDAVRKQHPRFVFMGNGARDGPGALRGVEIDLFEVGGGGAYVTDPKHRAGRWSTLADMCRQANPAWDRRGFCQHPYYILVPVPMGGPTATAGLLALALAYRFHLYTWTPLPALSTQGRPMARALRLAMRYSRYIYQLALRPIEPDALQLAVAAPERVLWRDFVYYGRDALDGPVLVLHLVNLPPQETIWRTEQPPPLRQDIPVRFQAPAGQALRDLWLLTPEADPMARPISVHTSGRSCRTAVPCLRHHAVLVARFRPAAPEAP